MPKKRDWEAKCVYYLDICKVFYDFRRHFQLTPEEFCVLFYCYAKRFISNPDRDKIPGPLRCFLVGANPYEDHELLQSISPASLHFWQGNSDTRIGDIILMYERGHSHISSIWRAVTEGCDDPFRYYPGLIWIGHPVKIPPVSFAELKRDAVWSQKGLVKARMQGISGSPCGQKEYEAFLEILRRKNFDVSVLPSLPKGEFLTPSDLCCEKDVETKLLEPFLKKLGLAEKDWTRQMPLRMGRKTIYYPDYVVHPNAERGNEKGAVVCEAKFRIPNKKRLKEDFDQAKSYARRLECRGLLLASCEGVWLSVAQDDYKFEKILSLTWGDLESPDTFTAFKIRFDKLLRKH